MAAQFSHAALAANEGRCAGGPSVTSAKPAPRWRVPVLALGLWEFERGVGEDGVLCRAAGYAEPRPGWLSPGYW